MSAWGVSGTGGTVTLARGLTLLVACLGIVAMASSPASAEAGTGSISGTVTDSLNAPLTGICVAALDSNGDAAESSPQTDVNGNYEVGGLASGGYRILFSDCVSRILLDQYYDNKPTLDSATPVGVTDGSETSGVNAQMAPPGSISGTVTDNSNKKLVGICVTTYDSDGDEIGYGELTDSNGHYQVDDLLGGSYRIEFSACYSGNNVVDEFYNNEQSLDSATTIAVSAGSDVSGMDLVMAIGGTISGTVTDDSNPPMPLDHICIFAHDSSGHIAGTAFTDSNGDYEVERLATGSYRLRFTDCGSVSQNVLDQYYDNKQTLGTATAIAVRAGSATSGKDVVLATGGTISGTVTDSSSAPLEDICVDAYDSNGDQVSFGVSTESNGDYQIDRLASGSYRLRFSDCYDENNVVGEFYNDKPDLASADPIAVTAGHDVSGKGAVLADGGSISGAVTNSSNAPLEDICVTTYDSNGDEVGYGVFTDSNGDYQVKGLAGGNYRIQFHDCFGNKNVVGEYFNDQKSLNSATSIPVPAGEDVSGNDAVLVDGGSISGTVTNSFSTPLEGICVFAYDSNGDDAGFGVSTDAGGAYRIGGLATGNYRIEFSACFSGYKVIGEYYNDKPDLDTADAIAVIAGQEVSEKDAVLAPAGTISGTVTDTSGAPLEDICVDAYDSNDDDAGFRAYTDSNGKYQVGDLLSGDYRIQFSDCFAENNTIDEFYDDSQNLASAKPITVTAGSDAPGTDAVLATSGVGPDTVIDSGPTGTITTNQATFTFRGDPANSTAKIECRLDEGAYADCPSPKTFGALSNGQHTASFRAVDADGNVDPSPATREFTVAVSIDPPVDVTPPDTVIDSGPSGTITTNQATFTFHGTPANDTAKIQCRLDGASFADCSSPKSFEALADGPHTVSFRAEDAAGNQDQTPATRDFTVAVPTGPTGNTDPPAKAKIKKVVVKGPNKAKKGKKATYKVKIKNSGNANATGVKLKVSGKGVKAKKSVGKVPAGKTKTVKVKLKLKKTGKVKVKFKVTSKNAGAKTTKKKIKVKR